MGVDFEMGYNVGKFAVFWPSDYIQISLRTNRDSHDKHFDPLHDLWTLVENLNATQMLSQPQIRPFCRPFLKAKIVTIPGVQVFATSRAIRPRVCLWKITSLSSPYLQSKNRDKHFKNRDKHFKNRDKVQKS
jgi:hypothetical protein